MKQEFTNFPAPGVPSGKEVAVAVALILRETPNKTPISGALHAANHHILITKRKSNTPYAGYWEFPGGKIDPGESPEAAARRECREELSVEVLVLSVLGPIVHTYDHATVRLFPCVCRLAPSSPPPRNIEVADHRWCALDALPWDEFLPANVRLVTALWRHLSGHAV